MEVSGRAATAGHPYACLVPRERRAAVGDCENPIADPANDVFVSAASGWEITTKFRTGRWPTIEPLAKAFRETIAIQGFVELPITVEHACLSGTLAGAHGDPFDRMLAVQSLTENMPLISLDSRLDQFAATRLW